MCYLFTCINVYHTQAYRQGQRHYPKVMSRDRSYAVEADRGCRAHSPMMPVCPSVSMQYCCHPSVWLSIRLSTLLPLSTLTPGASQSKHVDWPWHASPSFFAFFPRCLIALDRPSGLCGQFLICSHTSYFFHPISTALLSILLSVAGDMQGALICFLRDI